MPASFTVAARRRETHDTWTLSLEQAAGGSLPRFQPGQFAMLYAFGTGEAPISVSGDLTGNGPLVHTVRSVGAVTESICSLREGDSLGVRGPYGTTWPLAEAEGRDVVIVAGGIGLAPLRPVIYALAANRQRYGSIGVLYGGRSPAELLYTDELERWRDELSVEVAVDTADGGWNGHVGVVTTLVPRVQFDPAETVAMICGPEVMMRFAAAALADHGVPDSAIWLSLERSMKCGVGFCGHCQLGPLFICKDGPVFRRDAVAGWMGIREL